MNHKFAMKV